MRNKALYLVKDTSIKELVEGLCSRFGIPEANATLGIYAEHEKSIIEISFENSHCYLRKYQATEGVGFSSWSEVATPPIQIENRNIKYFLRVITSLGFPKANISDEVTALSFRANDEVVCKVEFGTPIGAVCTVYKTGQIDVFDKIFENLEQINHSDIKSRFHEIPKENILEAGERLNSKILAYANTYGIDLIKSAKINIHGLLSNKSNDYSGLESHFKKCAPFLRKLPGISIIIPSYNTETVFKTLLSIQGQDLEKSDFDSFEVIVVDDGSSTRVYESIQHQLNEYGLKFSFNLRIIRNEQNLGLSTSRNIGAMTARHENLIFLDADILLANNYLKEHARALSFYPDSVFVSMKHNINDDTEFTSTKNILAGLSLPENFNDKRITRFATKGQDWVHSITLDGEYDLLGDSDMFKRLGHGRVINGFDLPSMVVGHNMSLKKSLFRKIGGFSTFFKGWGLEDTYFGALAISKGAFVIPIVESGVFHLEHPPRAGSQELQKEEYKRNLQIYENLIMKEL